MTKKAQHTPEPWILFSDETQSLAILPVGRFGAVARFKYRPSGADADRIVAAVNACEGIPTEALEQGAVKDLLVALRRAEQYLEVVGGAHPSEQDVLAQVRAALTRAKP